MSNITKYPNVEIDESIMHLRSHKFPENDKYVDTTYYDETNESLDLGFQGLKQIMINLYPEFSYLNKLFLDHNNLTFLPSAKHLPMLEYLTCSFNFLKEIPFYPNLTFLNTSHNKITNCHMYSGTKLKYFDCSYNSGFVYDIYLPQCRHLYINNTDLRFLNLKLLPNLNFLDCSNNVLRQINESKFLIELNIQYNKICFLPFYPNLKRLMADFNYITVLESYPKLKDLTISHNKLIVIKDQPLLEKIIANNNNIKKIDDISKSTLVDLSHNNLSFFILPNKIEYLSLQFNPILHLNINFQNLKSIKELQTSFETYKFIYKKYFDNIDVINIQTNHDKLKYLLGKLNGVFDEYLSDYIFEQFCKIKFKEREIILYNITQKLFCKIFKIENLRDEQNSENFKKLLNNMTNFYYKTIVATLYFNGYCN